jgi:hypothetical protein
MVGCSARGVAAALGGWAGDGGWLRAAVGSAAGAAQPRDPTRASAAQPITLTTRQACTPRHASPPACGALPAQFCIIYDCAEVRCSRHARRPPGVSSTKPLPAPVGAPSPPARGPNRWEKHSPGGGGLSIPIVGSSSVSATVIIVAARSVTAACDPRCRATVMTTAPRERCR